MPDIHSVFAETRMVYRIIELEKRSREQEIRINELERKVKKQERLNIDIIEVDKYIMEKVNKIKRKQGKISKHMGGLTVFTIGKYKSIVQCLGKKDKEIEALTVQIKNLKLN